MSKISLRLEQASELAIECLSVNGFDRENSIAIANRMIEAERDHCHSHGLFRLPWIVKGLQLGRVNGKAKPTIEQIAPALIKVDGDNGLAPLGQGVAHEPLVKCAKENGIAALGFVNMFHLGAIWPEVERLANDGLCAIACTASYPYVAPAGGIKPLFGTNPIGFAWPRIGKEPLVFDQASSAMARGEIQIAARDGKQIPDTAGIGPNGETTNDPNLVLEGAQLGFGGYKGAALAMMVELLAGPLIDEFLSIEALQDDAAIGGPPKGGELLIAIDPAKFGSLEKASARGEKLFDEILKQDGTRLPSQRRFNARKVTAYKGIEIPTILYDEITALKRA